MEMPSQSFSRICFVFFEIGRAMCARYQQVQLWRLLRDRLILHQSTMAINVIGSRTRHLVSSIYEFVCRHLILKSSWIAQLCVRFPPMEVEELAVRDDSLNKRRNQNRSVLWPPLYMELMQVPDPITATQRRSSWNFTLLWLGASEVWSQLFIVVGDVEAYKEASLLLRVVH